MWRQYFKLLLGVLVILWLQSVNAQRVPEIQLGDLLRMQQGTGWPANLTIVEGHDALMKLTVKLDSQLDCKVVTPTGLSFSILSPPSDRYELWSDGCGLRVRDISSSDAGRWRLTAVSVDNSVTGWIAVDVQENITSYQPAPIVLPDNSTRVTVPLISLNNTYCLVRQPFTDSSLVTGQCQMTFVHTTRAMQGRWGVQLGLPGRMGELDVEADVLVQADILNAGFIRDTQTNKLHMYCNVLNATVANVTLCRFQKTTESLGFNVGEGLSDGRHSYYGEGFLRGECGMTIETVTDDDYGSWRCTVGLRERVSSSNFRVVPRHALIRVPPTDTTIRQETTQKSPEVRSMFIQTGLNFTVMCNTDMSLSYCWFQHPNGSQLNPTERRSSGAPSWYAGDGLQAGYCGITIARATVNDAGIWRCHMGPLYELGLEETEQINVRVTGPLAAPKTDIVTSLGEEVTLTCETANGPNPIDYCRFLSPTALGFKIGPAITAETAILGRYYFTPGKDLSYGDCSLTISNVHEEDIGEWTCGAMTSDDVLRVEARDTINLHLAPPPESFNFQAGILGISIGLLVLAIILVATIWYKKFHKPTPRLSEVSSAVSTSTEQYSASETGSQTHIHPYPKKSKSSWRNIF